MTHSFLRSCDHFEVVIYRYRAEVYKHEQGRGGHLSKQEKERILFEKALVQHEARTSPLHLKLDQPDPYGHGGNSDTANTARIFFSEKARPHIVKLFKPKTEEDKEKIEDLLHKFNVVLRVLSCKQQVRTNICLCCTHMF